MFQVLYCRNQHRQLLAQCLVEHLSLEEQTVFLDLEKRTAFGLETGFHLEGLLAAGVRHLMFSQP